MEGMEKPLSSYGSLETPYGSAFTPFISASILLVSPLGRGTWHRDAGA